MPGWIKEWGPFLVREIPDIHGRPYLKRWSLFRRIHLHRFVGPDTNSAPHNHPWHWAFSVILRGGYEEEIWQQSESGEYETRRYVRKVGQVNQLMQSRYHLIQKLLRTPTWTIMITSAPGTDWGFLDRRTGEEHLQWIHWQEYLGEA